MLNNFEVMGEPRDGSPLANAARQTSALRLLERPQLKQRPETLVGHKAKDETAGVYGYEYYRAARGRTGRKAHRRQEQLPEFQPGDTVVVNVKVTEGERTRVQAYEGVCIARNGGGLNESFTVRKISYGEGVERVFPVYSPMIDSIKLVRRGKVRRAKLYYLRDRRGKSARIAERVDTKPKA